MKKTKNNIVYGSWQNRERHGIEKIYGNGTIGNVGPTGWVCKKCGLTVVFGNDKNNNKKREKNIIAPYLGGHCLFLTESDELVETKTDWTAFIVVFTLLVGLLGFLWVL